MVSALAFTTMQIKRGGLLPIAALIATIFLVACATPARPHGTNLTNSTSIEAGTATPGQQGLTNEQDQQRRPSPGNPAGHAYVPPAGRAVNTNAPNHVVGNGTPSSCTSSALVDAVAKGGIITFNCGPNPVTITMTATAKVKNTSHQVVLDGGGLVTLNGAGKHQILYMNTCDSGQDLTTGHCFDQEVATIDRGSKHDVTDGYSAIRQNPRVAFGGGGGGAIFAEGGQLRVVNSRFIDNSCYEYGPDLGGAAIRALAQYGNLPVYITSDTFSGGQCSNGGALSSISVSWDVINSVFTDNKAIGWEANPPTRGTPGGGSGGAIYNDGDSYNLAITDTVIDNNDAREGGGAVFFVVDNRHGTLTIENSTLDHNPSHEFWTSGYPGIYYLSSGRPIIVNSTIK